MLKVVTLIVEPKERDSRKKVRFLEISYPGRVGFLEGVEYSTNIERYEKEYLEKIVKRVDGLIGHGFVERTFNGIIMIVDPFSGVLYNLVRYEYVEGE